MENTKNAQPLERSIISCSCPPPPAPTLGCPVQRLYKPAHVGLLRSGLAQALPPCPPEPDHRVFKGAMVPGCPGAGLTSPSARGLTCLAHLAGTPWPPLPPLPPSHAQALSPDSLRHRWGRGVWAVVERRTGGQEGPCSGFESRPGLRSTDRHCPSDRGEKP